MAHLWSRTFVAHPRSVGESYLEHFSVAARFGLQLLAAGFACLVHALVPGWCTSSASRAVAELADEMARRRAASPYAVAAAAGSSSEVASLHSRSRS